MKAADEARLFSLFQQRWAALGTRAANAEQIEPYVSWVGFLVLPDLSGLVMHLSRLAPHTRNLLAHGRASLSVSEADGGVVNPQELARMSVRGNVLELARDDVNYAALKTAYIERFPESEMLFEFADFSLFILKPDECRYVEGFASTHRFKSEQLRDIALSHSSS